MLCSLLCGVFVPGDNKNSVITQHSVNLHIKTVHDGEKVICPCDKQFATNSCLGVHIRVHIRVHEKRKYSCEVCQKTLRSKGDLKKLKNESTYHDFNNLIFAGIDMKNRCVYRYSF